MGLVQFNGSQDLPIRTVWYGGTSTLQEGQVVVYDTSDTTAPVSNSWDPSVDPGPNQISPTSNRSLRGNNVTDVTSALTGGMAGLVAAGSGGKTGPTFIDIVVPRRGDVVNCYTKVSMTKNSTAVGVDIGTPSNNVVSFSDSTLNINLIGIALETKDTSTTAGPALIKIL